MYSTQSEENSNVENGDGSSVEIVNEFCYLRDMLSVDEDADVAVTARIQFQVTGLLSGCLLLQGKVLHGR